MKYICTSCGGDWTTVSAARPSLDDRYAVGYCERCTPVPKMDPNDRTRTKPLNRSTVPLVRADVFSLDAMAERDRKRRESRLVKAVAEGKRTITPAMEDEAAAIRARWAAEAEQRRSA